MNNITSKKWLVGHLIILCSFFLNAQTYWDANTNGQPVKEELSIRFDQTGAVVDTTKMTYYSDGKMDTYYQSVLLGPPDGERFWSRQLREYIYQSDTLYMIKSNNGGETIIEVVKLNFHKIFPVILKGYKSELEAKSNQEPNGEIVYSYDENYRTTSQRVKNEYQTSVSKFFYQEGDLARIEGAWEDPYGNSDSWNVTFEVTEKGKFGWSEMFTNIPDGTKHRTVRTVKFFTKEERKNSNVIPSTSTSNFDYTLTEIIELWRGDVNSFSPDKQRTAQKTKLLEMGVELFEKDKSKIENSDYSPLFFYKNIAEFYYKDEPKLAIEWAKRGLDFFGDGYQDSANELTAMIAYLYRNIQDHEEALKYYEMIPKPEYGIYDPMGNYYELTRIKFLIRGGKLEEGREELTPIHDNFYGVLTDPDFDISNAEYKFILMLRDMGEIGELLGDFEEYEALKTTSYGGAEFYFNVVKDYYESKEGKESEEYINALKNLIRVKKAQQK